MPDISSANAIYMLGVASVFAAPQQLQGFSADDIFDSEPIDTAEISMGVDGILSGGFVFQPAKQSVTLQADSDSNAFFEAWYNAQVAQKTVFYAFGLVTLSSINRDYVLTRGVLTAYPPMPSAGRILKPRKYGITWQSIAPVPTG